MGTGNQYANVSCGGERGFNARFSREVDESARGARFREWACLARLYGPPRVLQPVTLEYLSTEFPTTLISELFDTFLDENGRLYKPKPHRGASEAVYELLKKAGAR